MAETADATQNWLRKPTLKEIYVGGFSNRTVKKPNKRETVEAADSYLFLF